MTVHPTAIIHQSARLHPTVTVGPFARIGEHVEIGANTTIGSSVVIDGHTTIGEDNVIHPSVIIGAPPQDLKYKGEKTFVKIGNGNHFREFTTVHLAEGEGNSTIIGDGNLFMAYVHIAHNCHVGSNNIMSNCTTLAGHVEIGNRAVLGGFTGIHQFCKVGSMVMIGGMSKIVKDVPPFIKIDGNPARVVGLNAVGLRRNNVSKESLASIKELYKVFFRSEMNVSQVLAKWQELLDANDENVKLFYDFIKNSKRGVYKRTRRSSVSEE
ncbi:MAG: acyl-[acyl-carrier-protein]--UDP-N-acetylglucosamine O-acyltransferase [Candidatus Riflebacteria bacterium HGW-Riflebacteria-2]|jgi:UDP-N-acetylglucosamine acyltransferase|nr:MAG: acyl-[acyl-carrier-protein]--UDP-N-acetylglucosamine O-acyltransferase [Candidatus Riflebacteria bacterium HGW-Riflebacteria-2]